MRPWTYTLENLQAGVRKLESGNDRETERNLEDENDLETWLGGRDSNPDNVVQSHVSYRWTTSQYQQRRARDGKRQV